MRTLLCLLFVAGLSAQAMARDLDARLDWSQRVELGSLVSGVVSKIPIKVGQRVKQGDPLVVIDARDFNARLLGASASLQGSSASLAEAKREMERTEELYDRTVISEHEYQLAQVALAKAEAMHATTKARHINALLDLEHSRISAPFDGMVVAVSAAPGQVVVSELQSRPLVTLAADRPMLARAQVDFATLDSLSMGQPVSVNVAGQDWPGEISSLALEPVDRNTDLFDIEVSFSPDDQRLLRPGQPATVRIP